MNVDANNKPVPRWQAGDWLFRLLIPIYIAGGALLKLFTANPMQLPLFNTIIEPTGEQERLASWMLPTIVCIELICAAVIAFHRGLARWLAAGVLAVFAAVLILQLRSKATSCGCFGAIETDPTMMLISSCVGIGLIFLLPCRKIALGLCNGRWMWIILSAVVAIMLTLVVSTLNLPEKLGTRLTIVRFRPAEWRGMRWNETTIAGAVDGPLNWPEREKTVMLWMRRCPHCHELFRTRFGTPDAERVVAIEIPASARGYPAAKPETECMSCDFRTLKVGRFYILPETPVVLRVVDGVVVSVNINAAEIP